MLKVLIVEDDLILSMLNKKNVELLGHKVIATATNGKSAIEATKTHDPDIILMDLRLDDKMDGIDTMKEIAKFADTPVIYITGNSDEKSKERAAETNMLGFCIKPINFQQLQMLLSEVKCKNN